MSLLLRALCGLGSVAGVRPCGTWRGLGSSCLVRRGVASRAGVLPGRTPARAASNSEASKPTCVFWLSTALKRASCLSSALRRRSSYSRRVALSVPLMKSSTAFTSRPRKSPRSVVAVPYVVGGAGGKTPEFLSSRRRGSSVRRRPRDHLSPSPSRPTASASWSTLARDEDGGSGTSGACRIAGNLMSEVIRASR